MTDRPIRYYLVKSYQNLALSNASGEILLGFQTKRHIAQHQLRCGQVEGHLVIKCEVGGFRFGQKVLLKDLEKYRVDMEQEYRTIERASSYVSEVYRTKK